MRLFDDEHSPPQVWAVEDTSVQITWGKLGPGKVTASVPGHEVTIDHLGGPGALDIPGLQPGAAVTIDLLSESDGATLETTTMATPPGPELSRFATISDLHLGARRWGALNTMTDPSGHAVPHPFRCALSAIEDAVAWGAELLIIKGDAVQHEVEADFAQLGDLVDRFPDLPMLLIPGNHDVDCQGEAIPLGVGKRELTYTRNVDAVDLPGVRVVVGDTSIPGRGRGSLDRVSSALMQTAAEADRPIFVAIHHQLQPTRIPRHWPLGIPAPQSSALLDQLADLPQPVTVSSGHTHRNRSRRHRDVLVTEVGSTKDWPGVWAGYVVHEGGVRQVVRRSAARDAITWTEYSRDAVAGLWGKWSPGPMDERCVANVWTPDRSS